MDKVVKAYEGIFTSPAGVPLHCQVKHSIDMTLGALLPNGPIYWHSIMENDEIKRQIQDLLHKGHIQPISLLDRVGTEEGWDMETLYWLSGAEQDHCSE